MAQPRQLGTPNPQQGQPQQGQPQQGQQPPTPGGQRQALSAGLMNAAFGFFGSAAAEAVGDPSVAGPVQQIGADIAGAMRDRWHKREYDEFLASHGEDFKQNSKNLLADFQQKFAQLNNGIVVDEAGNTMKVDPKGEHANRLRDNWYDKVIMDFKNMNLDFQESATKHSKNPYVNMTVANMVNTTSQLIQGITGPPPSQASEQNYAQTELTREEAAYKRRLPAASGEASKKDKDPLSVWEREIQKHGPEKGAASALNIFQTDDSYVFAVNPSWTAMKEELRQQLRTSPKFKEQAENPVWLEEQVQRHEDRLRQLAVGRYAINGIPGAKDLIESFPSMEHWIPKKDEFLKNLEPQQETAPTLTADLPKEELKIVQENLLEKVLKVFEELVLTDKPEDYDSAVGIILEEDINPFLDELISDGTRGASDLKRKLRKFLLERLYDKRYVAKRVPAVAEHWEIKRGIMDRSTKVRNRSLLSPAPKAQTSKVR